MGADRPFALTPKPMGAGGISDGALPSGAPATDPAGPRPPRLIRAGDRVRVQFALSGRTTIEVAQITRIVDGHAEHREELDLDAIPGPGWFLVPRSVPVLGLHYHVYLSPAEGDQVLEVLPR